MPTAAAANEYSYNAGVSDDYSISEFYNDEYAEVVEPEEVDEKAERQRINGAMAEWFGLA
jgi:hypothetical protein